MKALGDLIENETVMQKLIAEEFDDQSLHLLTESDLDNMNITQRGLRAKMLNYTKNMNSPSTSSPASQPSPSSSSRFLINEMKNALKAASSFRNIYFTKLDYDNRLDQDEIGSMADVLTDYYFYDDIMIGRYPSTSHKRELAKQIILMYPHLRSTEHEIPEFDFFANIGGINYGTIENRVRALRKRVSKEFRLFTKGTTTTTDLVPVSEELKQKAKIIATYPCTSQYRSTIAQALVRACLILMKEMPVRGGVKRKLNTDEELSGNEIFAATLIRWIEDDELTTHLNEKHDMHLVCEASAPKTGNYYVYLDAGQHIYIGQDTCRAIDVLFKSFVVFGQQVPMFLTRLYTFLAILCYGTESFTTFKCVAKCVERFKLCEANTEQ